jgi:hypothetical protein
MYLEFPGAGTVEYGQVVVKHRNTDHGNQEPRDQNLQVVRGLTSVST